MNKLLLLSVCAVSCLQSCSKSPAETAHSLFQEMVSFGVCVLVIYIVVKIAQADGVNIK